ncbi:WD40 repeat-like protein [Serendipita vermifera]|nr:WD40 repeat-like protein [Serendipita vermifera]
MSGRGKKKFKIIKPNPNKLNLDSAKTRDSTNKSRPEPDRTKYQETTDGFILGFNIVREISEATSLLAPLKATCLLIGRGLETTRKMNNNKRAWKDFTKKLESQLRTIEKYQEEIRGSQNQFELEPLEPLSAYSSAVKEVLTQALKADKQSRNIFKKIIRSSLDEEDVKDWTEEVQDAYKAFQEAMQISILKQSLRQGEMMDEVKSDLRLLVQRRQGKEYKNDEQWFHEFVYGLRLDLCQEGTRAAVLDQIRDWANNENATQQIFWLNDTPGAGKSTVAATIAHEWVMKKRLAGRFFFTNASNTLSSLTDFCVILSKDLSTHQRGLAPVIQKAIKTASQFSFSLEQQFQTLIVEPLQALNQPVMFILDAIDICNANEHRKLLQQLINHLPSIPKVKVLITSRPLPSISEFLESSLMVIGKDTRLSIRSDEQQDPDILHFVKESIHFGELTEEEKSQMVTYSEGLFEWISTADRLFQRSRETDKVLKRLLETTQEHHLDVLYLQCLKRAEVEPKNHEALVDVLRVILFSKEPVSTSVIEVFQPRNRSVRPLIRDLGSVIQGGSEHHPLWFIHSSFRDYLLQRPPEDPFYMQPTISHTLLAKACLSCLTNLLRYDMTYTKQFHTEIPYFNKNILEKHKHRIGFDTFRLDEGLYDALKYAIKYWAWHVSECVMDAQVSMMLTTFFNNKLLNWMEMLSLMSIFAEGMESMRHLCRSLEAAQSPSAPIRISNTLSICRDIVKFMRRHQRVIAEAALHVYQSALPFTDHSNFVYQEYSRNNMSRMPKLLSKAPKGWCGSRQLGNSELAIQQATFSPDGSKVATSLADGTLALWNLQSGECTGLYRPAPNVKNMAFTPDGRKLATDTGSSEALLWDGESAEFLDVRFKGHRGLVTVVVVSQDGKYLITGSSDKTIRFWDLETNKMERRPLMEHWVAVESLSLSRDGRFLASTGGSECAVWRLEDRRLVHMEAGLHGGVNAVDFVNEMGLLVTGGNDGTLVLTDFVQKKRNGVLQGHTSSITCLTTSVDGKLAVSGDDEGRVCLWDLQNLTQIGEACMLHQSAVSNLSISQDQLRIISTGKDNTLLVSDVTTGRRIGGPFAAEGSSSSCITISPDQSKVLMGSTNGGIQIWDLDDMHTDESPPEEVHTGPIGDLFFSPDMSIVLSCAKGDKMARMWDARTGEYRGTLAGHSEDISSVAFSPRGDLLATGSSDATIQIWSTYDGSPHGLPLQGHLHEVTALAFSVDGNSLVSGSKDQKLLVWDVTTGEAKSPLLEGHTNAVSVIVPLHSGKILSASEDGTTRIWEPVREDDAGSMTSSVLITHTGPVPPGGMILSSDEKLLACASRNTTLELWSLESSTPSRIKNLHRPSTNPQGQFRFSDNDSYVWFGNDVYPTAGSRPVTSITGEYALSQPLSGLYYQSGWIYSTGCNQPLVAIPKGLRVSQWIAYEDNIVLGLISGHVLIMDCYHLLRS